jgi:hypothetical protein
MSMLRQRGLAAFTAALMLGALACSGHPRDADDVGAKVVLAFDGCAGEAPQHFEMVLELSYILQITPWLQLEPDIQYVIEGMVETAWSRIRFADFLEIMVGLALVRAPTAQFDAPVSQRFLPGWEINDASRNLTTIRRCINCC